MLLASFRALAMGIPYIRCITDIKGGKPQRSFGLFMFGGRQSGGLSKSKKLKQTIVSFYGTTKVTYSVNTQKLLIKTAFLNEAEERAVLAMHGDCMW